MEPGNPILVFTHRVFFIIARAILLIGFPVFFIKGVAVIRDDFYSITGYVLLIASFIVPVFPAYLMKYVFRLTCPYCKKGKMDKELIGAGDYQCLRCRKFWS